MAKFHIGVVTGNRSFDDEIKSAAEQMGGAYIHHSRDLLELIQKLTLQKIQMILLILPQAGEGSDYFPLHHFIRSKKDLQNIPVCILTEAPQMRISFLLRDPLVRAFPLAGGFFLPLISMKPLLGSSGEEAGAVSDDWIRSEFVESFKELIGQNIGLQTRDANEDERRAPFFAQQSDEIRTHLGWFKFTARLLESETSGTGHLFQGLNRDMAEATAQNLTDRVIECFSRKVMDDLLSRGAVALPEREKLPAEDRKWLSAQGRHRGILFYAPECQLMLEISRYL